MAPRRAARTSRRPAAAKREPPIPPEGKDPATRYARLVLSGKIVAGPHIRNACRRHLQDLVEGPKRGLAWDLDAALRVIGFFQDELRLGGGQFEGAPFIPDISQKFILASLFGWKRRNGTRRFRRAYIEEAKGNGKSPLAAGVGHYCLVADDEPRAEVYCAAAAMDQAMVPFRDAVAMYEQSPNLRERLTPSGGNPVWNLADLQTGSFFRPISSEKRKKGSGPRPSLALCDEVHEHPDGLMIETLERGFKFRRQPLLVMTTNSGSDRGSVCWEEHNHAIRAAAGTRDADHNRFDYVGDPAVASDFDDSFSFVCSLDPDDDPLEDPGCWIKANPLLGKILEVDYLKGVVAQAKSLPGKLNGILRLHFCVWTDADAAWMSRATLESCLAEFDPSIHAGKGLYGGVDLAATQDLAPIAYVVPTGTVERERVTPSGETFKVRLPTFDAWVEAWTPGDTLAERALRDQQPYEVWVREGHLHAPPGKIVRMDFMAARVAEVNSETPFLAFAYDRYAFRKHFESQLDEMGLTIPLVEHPQGGVRRAKPTDEQIEQAKREGREPPQGLWMPGSVSELELLLLEQRIRIRRSPVIVSAVMGAVLERDAFDNKWFSKRKATIRIDPLVALAMAVGAATAALDQLGGSGSIYDDPVAYARVFGASADPTRPKEPSKDAPPETDPVLARDVAPARDWDPKILADPTHPDFADHKRRFEAWQDDRAEEE